MAITTTCPSCRGPLRVPDELMGKQVRCPACQTVFTAAADTPNPVPPAAPAAERPLWKDLNLELGKNDPQRGEEPPPPPRSRGPALKGAVEVGPPGRDEPPPPPPQGRTPAPSPPPSWEGIGGPERGEPEEDEDYPGRRRSRFEREPPRRDSEPHRGVLIMVLGIISLVCVALSFCYGLGALIGIPLGITAWVLGHGDLRKIKEREMDEEGLGMTQAGWICGIIGTILNTLVVVSCGGLIVALFWSASLNTPPKPAFAPSPPPAVGK